jgi:hypothetical protein
MRHACRAPQRWGESAGEITVHGSGRAVLAPEAAGPGVRPEATEELRRPKEGRRSRMLELGLPRLSGRWERCWS